MFDWDINVAHADNGGIWSQQQKLTAVEFINYYKDGAFREVRTCVCCALTAYVLSNVVTC
jgi:hypothetical protein